MKQITILSGRCLVVELPEGSDTESTFVWDSNFDEHGILCPSPSLTYGGERLMLPPGNWRIIGMLSEVTEEQAEGLVEWNEVLQYYPDYSMDGLWNGDITALESLESAILAEGYGFSNPCGDLPSKTDMGHALSWDQAQSRVLDRSRCLLLMRVG